MKEREGRRVRWDGEGEDGKGGDKMECDIMWHSPLA